MIPECGETYLSDLVEAKKKRLAAGDNNSKWVKHWVKGGYHYYHNLETQAGGWAEPPDFVQNSVQLSREEIQVGHLSSHKKDVRESASGLLLVQRRNTCGW